MDWQAKLVAAAATVLAVLVLSAVEGCLSAVSQAPVTSIVEESRPSDDNAAREVQHQPTILRAEAAAPPVSDRPEAWPIIPDQADEPFAESPAPVGVTDAGSAQVADLLPVQPLSAAPPSQR